MIIRTNYRILFIIGIILLSFGIILDSLSVVAVAVICVSLSLANKEKWGRNKAGKTGVLLIGNHSYGNPEVRVWTRKNAEVRIGKYCSIADNVCFVIDGNHKMDLFSTFPFRNRLGWKECELINWGKENPVLGNDIWIGSDVVIYSGVIIGDGAIIAGQSVVTKSVPPYAVVAGNPAVIKKYRFDRQTINKLLEYRWWDLPEEIIREKLIPNMSDIKKICLILEKIKKENSQN